VKEYHTYSSTEFERTRNCYKCNKRGHTMRTCPLSKRKREESEEEEVEKTTDNKPKKKKKNKAPRSLKAVSVGGESE
jgi:hypothetical protein